MTLTIEKRPTRKSARNQRTVANSDKKNRATKSAPAAPGALAYRLIETPIGAIAIVASPRGLRKLIWAETAAAVRKDVARENAREDATLLPKLADELRRFANGERVTFTVPLDPDSGSDLQRDIWHACRQVGYGKTASYGDLAERVGRPGAARAVGTAMARNPFPLVVPCHRIVRSDGGLGGYSGPSGVSRKKRLLEMEAATR